MMYELDERSFTGCAEIDQAHVKISELSQHLAKLLENKADFDEVYAAFVQLQAVLREHFDVEERDIKRLPQNDEVCAHLLRHTENHNQFRDLLTYGEEQLEQNRTKGQVPNVAGLIPQEYFEELKDIDFEMKTLFARYGFAELTSH